MSDPKIDEEEWSRQRLNRQELLKSIDPYMLEVSKDVLIAKRDELENEIIRLVREDNVETVTLKIQSLLAEKRKVVESIIDITKQIGVAPTQREP